MKTKHVNKSKPAGHRPAKSQTQKAKRRRGSPGGKGGSARPPRRAGADDPVAKQKQRVIPRELWILFLGLGGNRVKPCDLDWVGSKLSGCCGFLRQTDQILDCREVWGNVYLSFIRQKTNAFNPTSTVLAYVIREDLDGRPWSSLLLRLTIVGPHAGGSWELACEVHNYAVLPLLDRLARIEALRQNLSADVVRGVFHDDARVRRRRMGPPASNNNEPSDKSNHSPSAGPA